MANYFLESTDEFQFKQTSDDDILFFGHFGDRVVRCKVPGTSAEWFAEKSERNTCLISKTRRKPEVKINEQFKTHGSRRKFTTEVCVIPRARS